MNTFSKRDLLRTAGLGVLSTAVPGWARAQAPRPGIIKSTEIAEAGFVYGLPIVMNYAVMYEFFIDKTSSQYKAPFNQIYNEARVFTYKDTTVITPNSDTPYSLLGLDLRAEPVVLSIPAVAAPRYYAVQLTDASTYNFGYFGCRTTGTEAGSFMVVGPDWKGETPAGIKKVFRSGSAFAVAILRTQLFNAGDMDGVKAVQDGYKCQTLSAFLKQPAPPAAPPIDFPKVDTELAKKNFFEYVDFMLQFIPGTSYDKDIRAKLASIGIGPGKTFEFKSLSLEDKAEIGIGMKIGDKKVDEALAKAGADVNGWRVGSFFGTEEVMNADWMRRAIAARGGIYGNDGDEAMYPLTKVDHESNTLDGSEHAYTLTFAKGNLPPVNAFWSITMYDGKTQLLIENPINRYLINSPMMSGMKTNADGSLTIYIQKNDPGPDKQANWLPAPNGPIYLVMRLYWPKTGNPSILPAGKGTWKPPGIVRAA